MKEDKEIIEETEEIQEEIITEEVEQESDNDTKDKEIEELNNKLARLQADFVNFRKRTEKEKESISYYAIEPFVCSLLPIMDNFERALDSETDKENGFYKGIEMIYNQLIKSFNENNVEEILAFNQDFDPNFHHAVLMEESEDIESGKVTEVLQKGYILKEKVIRPSMVKVAK